MTDYVKLKIVCAIYDVEKFNLTNFIAVVNPKGTMVINEFSSFR